MKRECPKCSADFSKVKKNGHYKRKSDSKLICRFKCKACGKHFSSATFSSCYQQNRRRLNPLIKKLICSGVSMRRIALLFGTSRTTVKRKVEFLASRSRLKHDKWLESQDSFHYVQFDDLETFEHTKCKPVTVTIFVDPRKRKILGHGVAPIGAKGKLSHIALKKYGRRENKSREMREELFSILSPHIHKTALIESDMSLFYKEPIKRHFPQATHRAFKGRRGCVTGQGEMKKGGFDPLFKLNQSFAMIRDNLKRLTRKTWCTTKTLKALDDQIALYTEFHNTVLTA